MGFRGKGAEPFLYCCEEKEPPPILSSGLDALRRFFAGVSTRETEQFAIVSRQVSYVYPETHFVSFRSAGEQDSKAPGSIPFGSANDGSLYVRTACCS